MEKFVQVALNFPGPKALLTYKSDSDLEIGSIVQVPLGRRKERGVLISYCENSGDIDPGKIRFVDKCDDSALSLDPLELEFYQWLARYYHYSLGMAVVENLPKALKRPRDVKISKGKNLPLISLNPGQNQIVESLKAKLNNQFESHLIHGVTGSGKTLIYLHLMKECLWLGKSVLFLLPEINLTPQFTKIFLEHLDVPILAYHSAISNSQKYGIWKFLKGENAPVVVMGVRSSVFLPLKNIGLVIVDEEHDSSFKQSDRLPYNGRDAAIKKAQMNNCLCVLGSATPAVETFYLHQTKKTYHPLEQRVSGHFPEVEIIDSRGKEELTTWPFTKRAIEGIRWALEKREQILVFVNRLGFAVYIQCRACGYRFVDPNTGVALRYFKSKGILSSAHSDYKISMPKMCPECGNMNLLEQGFGTERLQDVLGEIFPEARIERFDRDEIKNITELEDRLDRFHRHEIDIFVGTQMLSKGHNFERVNTVVILGLDSMLNFPDFRAMERTYQTLTQILGRAGRYRKDAKVYVQTLVPETPVFNYALHHQFETPYIEELEVRRACGFPPFAKLSAIPMSSKNREKLIEVINQVADSFRSIIQHHKFDAEILGPAPAMIERRSGQYTWILLVKAIDSATLHKLLDWFQQNFSNPSGIHYKIDVDPYQTL